MKSQSKNQWNIKNYIPFFFKYILYIWNLFFLKFSWKYYLSWYFLGYAFFISRKWNIIQNKYIEMMVCILVIFVCMYFSNIRLVIKNERKQQCFVDNTSVHCTMAMNFWSKINSNAWSFISLMWFFVVTFYFQNKKH